MKRQTREETIYGKSTFKANIEADQRIKLTSWQRDHRKKYVEHVEIENLARLDPTKAYEWKLIISYTEERP